MVPVLYILAATMLLLLVLRWDQFILPVLLGFDAGMIGSFAWQVEVGWLGYIAAINGLGVICMLLAKTARARVEADCPAVDDLKAKKKGLLAGSDTLDGQMRALEEGVEAQKELYQAARNLSYVLSTRMFLHEARAVIEKFFSFRSAWFVLFGEGEEIHVRELRGREVAGLGPFERSFCLRLRETKEVAYVSADKPVTAAGAAAQEDAPFVTMPLIHRDEVWGSLVFRGVEPSRSRSRATASDHMEILSSLQHQFALSLSRVLLYDETERLSRTDALTGVSKRWYFTQRLQEEVDRCVRRNDKLSIIMVDIDRFKLFNDRYGHLAGDQALKRTAGLLSKSLRVGDLACRYGGEEFLLSLPSTPTHEAQSVAERIRVEISKLRFEFEGECPKITVSLGVATFPEHSQDIDEVILSADRMLYRAKWLGRNCTCVYEGEGENANRES